MSGYRTLHREGRRDGGDSDDSPKPSPVWSVKFSPCPQSRLKSASAPVASSSSSSASPAPLRLLTSSGDGLVRAYSLVDKSAASGGDTTSPLDATALKMKLDEVLLGSDQIHPVPDGGAEGELTLGAPAVDSSRNYTGSDPNAGGEVTASVELDGTVRVWTREEQPPTTISAEDSDAAAGAGGDEAKKVVRALHEFQVENAAGTTLSIRPASLGPARHEGYTRGAQVVAVAAGCLDGSVSVVSTGVPLHRRDVTEGGGGGSSSKSPPIPDAGTVLDRIGAGAALPTSLCWHSSSDILTVGRKDGTVDLYHSVDGTPYRRSHRITYHRRPVRALCHTSDGALLVVGCDDGHVTLHDASRRSGRPAMVASMLHAHRGYVLNAAPLNDGRRFVTGGADGCVKVWDVSQPNAGPVHAFEDGRGRGMVWCVDASGDGRRVVGGGDDGMVVIYSSEE